jgi:hypothetical protein
MVVAVASGEGDEEEATKEVMQGSKKEEWSAL